MATERAGAATFQGNGLTLVGDEVKVGDAAPDFSVLADDLSAVTLANYDGKVKVICLVPSLDTPVCDTEIRRFNQEACGAGRQRRGAGGQHGPALRPEALVRRCGRRQRDGTVRPPRHLPGCGLRRRDQGTAPAVARRLRHRRFRHRAVRGVRDGNHRGTGLRRRPGSRPRRRLSTDQSARSGQTDR